jgi:hypothetical protein
MSIIEETISILQKNKIKYGATKRTPKNAFVEVECGHCSKMYFRNTHCIRKTLNLGKRIICFKCSFLYKKTRTSKYKYNTDLFKVDNEFIYYLLGCFISDGNMRQNCNQCSLVSKDEDWITNIRDLIVPNIKLQLHNKSKTYTFSMCNYDVYHWLSTHGCHPQKSLTVKFPNNIPDKYLFDFIRGEFDGDGCIMIDRRTKFVQLKISFTSGSKDFLSTMQALLQERNIKSSVNERKQKPRKIRNKMIDSCNFIYNLQVFGSEAEKLCKLMWHKNCHPSFLQRKHNVWMEYLTLRQDIPQQMKFRDAKQLLAEGKTVEEIAIIYSKSIRQTKMSLAGFKLIPAQYKQFTKKEIIPLIKTKTNIELAKMYGITRSALWLRLKKMGIQATEIRKN